MQFVITAHDGKGMHDKRMEVRPLHLENMKRIIDHVVCAGGLIDDEGLLMGSVLVVEYDSREEVDEYLKTEPYVLAGVWDDISVEQINVLILNRGMVKK